MADGNVVLSAFFSTLVLVSAHLFSYRIYRYSKRHRSRVFSFFGGTTIAYVFLDLLPRLESTHIHLERIFGDLPSFLDTLAVPSLALLGFLVFFALEHLAVGSRHAERRKTGKEFSVSSASLATFRVHLLVLAFFNIVIGYILRFEVEAGIFHLLLYTFALSFHFIIVDNTMADHYKNLYFRYGRYTASLMPLIGWAISIVFPENMSEGYMLLALISGIILFNAIKDEVPKGGGKNPTIFTAGALSYSVLLLIVAWLRG